MPPAPHTSRPSRPSSVVLILFAVLIAGAALRVYRIGHESVWLDEAFSIEIAGTSLHHIVDETALDVHPPLYYFALHYWRHLGGDSEAGGRLFSAILSLGLILAGAGVARTLLGRSVALATMGLLAISPFQVQYAQEARMYALLGLLATLSTWALIRLLRRPAVSTVALYVIAASAMTYTQIYGMFVLCAHALTVGWLFFSDRPQARRVVWPWIASMALVGLLFVPWVPILVRQASAVETGFWIPEREWYRVLEPFLRYAGSVPLVVVLGTLAIVGLVRTRPGAPLESRVPVPGIVLLPWLIAPILVPFLISRVSSPIFLPKYTIPASIPFAILAAAGVMAVPRFLWRGLAWIAIVGLSIPAFHDYYMTPRKEGWRDAMHALQISARPTDLILVHEAFNRWAFDFYWRRKDVIVRAFPLTGVTAPAPDVLAARAQEVSRDYQRVWFVTTWSDPAAPAIAEALGRSLHEVTMSQSTGVETYLFERRP